MGFCVKGKQKIVPRTTNTDGIENYFNCSRQIGGSGDAPTAQEQHTNDATVSVFSVTVGPNKRNYASTRKIFEKKIKY